MSYYVGMNQFVHQLKYFICFSLVSSQVIAEGLTVYVSKPVNDEVLVGRVNLDNTTSTHSVIESDEFEYRQQELGKLVEHETGIQVKSSGGVGGFSSASIRGSSSEQVVVYIDGVPINHASGGGVDLSLISLSNIQSIETYRGSVPVELGNASLGGAINIITKEAAEGVNGLFKLTAGSFDTQKYNTFASAKSGRNSFILSADILNSENDFEFINDNGTPENSADDRQEKRNNAALSQSALLAKWKYKIDNDSTINNKIEWLDKDQEVPGVQNNPQADGRLLLENLDFYSQITQKQFASDHGEFSVKVFANKLDEKFTDNFGANGFTKKNIEVETDKLGTEMFYIYKLNSYQLKYRFFYENQDYAYEDLENNLSAQNSTRNYFEQAFEYKGFYLDNSLITSITLRQLVSKDENSQSFDVFGNPVDVDDREYQKVTPQLGVKYKFDARSYINFNIGEYIRLPSFFELFGDQGFFRGNSDLQEETGINMDIGYLQTLYDPGSWLDDAQIYVGLFNNTAENLIVRSTNAIGISVSQNITDSEVNGLEASLKVYPAESLSILFNATYLDSKNTSNTIAFNDKQLPGQFEQDYNLSFTYTLSSWISTVSWDVKNNMFYDRANLLPASDVSDLSFSLLHKWKTNSIELKVENILDNQYENFRLQPTSGTAYYLTYSQKF